MAEGLDLSKPVGPLPLGAWLVIVPGAIAVGLWWNKRNSSNDNGPILEAELGTGLGAGAFTPVNPGGGVGTGSAEMTTNDAWRIKVMNGLVAAGTYPPQVVDTAIRKYLSGQVLNVEENAVIGIALVRFGVPPEPVPGPAPSAPQPVTALTATRVPDPRQNLVVLNWWPSPGATSYYVRHDEGMGPDQDGEFLSPPVNWALAPNRNVTFTVVARNEYGNSDPRTVSVNTGGRPTGTEAPYQGPQNRPVLPNSGNVAHPSTHTVVEGDTILLIATKYYGTPGYYINIYNRNASAIEAAAKAAGKTSSEANGIKGWYLFPGTVLTLP